MGRFAELAPEKVYPSQLIELQAGYEYLTKTVGVDSSRICIGGDSAGGNLVASFLLHLVKPNEKLPIPSTPLANPGVSFHRLVSLRRSDCSFER